MARNEFWVTNAAINNPRISSHVSNVNEFDDGVRCYRADDVDARRESERNLEFWKAFALMLLGQVLWIALIHLTGRR